jgi:hypothetical protein
LSKENNNDSFARAAALASFPRSGNTWVRKLVEHATGNRTVSSHEDVLESRMFGEKKRRILLVKTHYPALIGPELDKALGSPREHFTRAVYLIRNPFDVLVSVQQKRKYFNRHRRFSELDDAFVEKQARDWAAHVRYWLHDSEFPVHVLRYEDLRDDPEYQLKRLFEFLGENVSSKQIEHSVEACSLERMRQEFTNKLGKKFRYFFRRGECFQNLERFTAEQKRIILTHCRKELFARYGDHRECFDEKHVTIVKSSSGKKNVFETVRSCFQNWTGSGRDPGQFVLISGVGHCGTAWTARLLHRPRKGVAAFHEEKNRRIGLNWKDALIHEWQNGPDEVHSPYWTFIRKKLDRHKRVVDSNSWSFKLIPRVNEYVPVHRVILLVRNGISNVHSLYQHNRSLPEDDWLYTVFFRSYWSLFENMPSKNEKLDSWDHWCLWWSLNERMPGWLAEHLGGDKVAVFRFEDLLKSADAVRELLEAVGVPHALSDREIRALQHKDINRKIFGDRNPGSLVARWSEHRRKRFWRWCGSCMERFGYEMPADD